MKAVTILSLIIILAVIYLLITASPLLGYELISDPYIPLGNIITWIGFIALPVSINSGISSIRRPLSKFSKILRLLIFTSMILAILWMPVSYFLADNWAANFEAAVGFRGSSKAAKYFWNYTYSIAVLPLIILFIYWISRALIIFQKFTFKNKEQDR